jgi:hypothetical protein
MGLDRVKAKRKEENEVGKNYLSFFLLFRLILI